MAARSSRALARRVQYEETDFLLKTAGTWEISDMGNWLKSARTFLESEDGTTMTEYALMLGFIALICFAAVSSVGTGARSPFTRTSAGF